MACYNILKLLHKCNAFVSIAQGRYLEADLFIHSYGPVGEGDGVAETGLPLDSFLGEIHDNLGSFGIRME